MVAVFYSLSCKGLLNDIFSLLRFVIGAAKLNISCKTGIDTVWGAWGTGVNFIPEVSDLWGSQGQPATMDSADIWASKLSGC
jgi:hypothetical protein